MNPFLVIILAALFIEYALSIISQLLNLKALKLEPPPELKDIYKPEKYRNSQEYTRVNIRFELFTITLRLIVLLVFWFAGGFNLLDQLIRSWGFVPVVNGLFYIGILMLAYSLLVLQLRQNRAKNWALTRLQTIGQACRAMTIETLRTTLEWAIIEITEKKKSINHVKAQLGLT